MAVKKTVSMDKFSYRGISKWIRPKFGEWHRFSELWSRGQVPKKDGPGIYVIAKFADSDPRTSPNADLSKNIVYIGKSSYQMSNRLGSWYLSAFKYKKDDSIGGGVYRRLGYATDENLYVAIWPIQKKPGEDPISFGLRIMEAEYALIMKYLMKYEEFPICNCDLRKPVYHKGKWNI